jgi:peptidoglycan/LPS O-acetylase OafA/YrhL
MFGAYRALLASLVVLLHYANVPFIGQYAVFGFFILSGYLMTLVMQTNYGYTVRGSIGYAVNRFLRIYPLYWFSCCVAVLVLLFLEPSFTTGVNGLFSLPESAFDWFRNIALLIGFNRPNTLIGPAWALTIELFFYLCIGLGLSRNRQLTLAWFVLSVIITLYLLLSGADFMRRYVTVGAASLPFATGALIFHWREDLQARLRFITQPTVAPLVLFLLLLLSHFIALVSGHSATAGFYLNYAVCALLVISLMGRKQLPLISRRLDNWLGDLSYPIYLIHYPLAFLFAFVYRRAGMDLAIPGPAMFLLSFPLLVLVSWGMAVGIERRIETLRTAIKSRVGA